MTRYAFIVHLRDIRDLIYALPLPKPIITALSPILKPLALWIFPQLSGRFGFSVRTKFKIGDKVTGYILLIWLTGQQITDTTQAHKVRRRILEAFLYAQNRLQCQIIGLGSLTSSVTSSGQWLANAPGVEAAITHGDSYTVGVSVEGIKKIAELRKTKLFQMNLAIVSATGIIGEALVYQLAPLVKNLILIARKQKILEAVKSKAELLGAQVLASTDIDDIRDADVVISATSWPGALIKASQLKQGAIVYDVAQPRNADKEVQGVIDGAFVKVPAGVDFGWWMSHEPGRTFGCMAEVTMQALEHDITSHIGKVDPDFVKEVMRRAEKYGFGHAPFTSFGEAISEERFLAQKMPAQTTRETKPTILIGQK